MQQLRTIAVAESACRAGMARVIARWLVPMLGAVALIAPANAAAMPAAAARAADPLEVRSVGTPPREALAGDAFTLSGRVRNSTARATRPRHGRKPARHPRRREPPARLQAAQPHQGTPDAQVQRPRDAAALAGGRPLLRQGLRPGRPPGRLPFRDPPAHDRAPHDVTDAARRFARRAARRLRHPRLHRGLGRQRLGRRRRLGAARARPEQPLPRHRGVQLHRRLHRDQPQEVPRGAVPQHRRRRRSTPPSRPRSRTTSRTAAASSASTRRSPPSRTGSS